MLASSCLVRTMIPDLTNWRIVKDIDSQIRVDSKVRVFLVNERHSSPSVTPML